MSVSVRMCVHVSVYVCVCVSVCVCRYICVYVCLRVCHMSACLRLYGFHLTACICIGFHL